MSSPAREHRVEAYAKLTLSLRVLGARPDGYHELEALTVSVSEPHDSVVVACRDDIPGVDLTVTGADAGADVPRDASNLAVRAARLLRPEGGVAIALHKGIPPGGGLGGASSDAAAVMRGLRALGATDVGDDALLALGASIGSDVPFCLRGGAAWMRGRGERIDPARVDPLVVLVATPPFGLSTPAVYRAWDDLGGPRSARVVPAPDSLAPLLEELVNDLEPAAERVEPRWRDYRERLEALVGRPALLAGSGSSCAVLYDDLAEAEGARRAVEAALPGRAWVGRSVE